MDLTHSVSVKTPSEDNFVHSKSTDLIKPKDSNENVHQTIKEPGGGEYKKISFIPFFIMWFYMGCPGVVLWCLLFDHH